MKKLSIYIVILASSLYGIMSCAKEDVQPEKTLIENLSLEQRNSNDTILLFQKLLSNNPNELKKINEKKYGSPSWKDVLLSKQTMFLPYFKPNTKEVLGVLIGHLDKIKKRTYFIFLEKEKIKTLKTESQVKNLNDNKPFTQEYAASVFLVLDKKIFNATDCGLVTIVKGNNVQDNALEERICSVFAIDSESGWDVWLGGTLVYSYREFSRSYEITCTAEGGGNSGGGYVDPFDWTSYLGWSGDGGVDCSNPNNACLSQCLDCQGRSKTCVECLNYDDEPNDNIIPNACMDDPIFRCIYPILIKGNYSLFNNTICPFDGSCNADIVFKWGYINSTDFKKNKNLIEITLTKDSNPLRFAATILHEGIHAAMRAILSDLGVDVSLINENEFFEKYYKDYVNKNIYYDQHVFMEEYYVKAMAKTLSAIDGNKYSYEMYMGLAWEGIDDSKWEKYQTQNNIVLNSTSLCK